jgi:type IV pilus assembly protein PilA
MATSIGQKRAFQSVLRDKCREFAHKSRQTLPRLLVGVAALTISSFVPNVSRAQQAATNPTPAPLPSDLQKYPGLLPEFGKLIARLQQETQSPAPRSQSRLLPLVPPSTIFYAALPNYGDVSQEILATFRSELQQSPVLLDWWQHGEIATSGPKLEDGLEKIHQFYEYLGDEIVVAGAVGEGGKDPKLLILAEVKKPGLQDFLRQASKSLSPNSKPPIRVLNPQELSADKNIQTVGQLQILVRPDFVVAATDLSSLREFSARLDQNRTEFASTAFGQRVVEAYQGGASVVAAADVQQVIKQIPTGQNQKTFERTGFADTKYAVWSYSRSSGQAASQAELSFTGPRHGIASWLAAPGPMGSLDFVPSKAAMAGAILLKDPAIIFDDVSDLAVASNPKAMIGLEQMQRGLQLNLRADLLRHLTGEIAYEIDSMTPPNPSWKMILGVDDPFRVQAAFAKLLAMAPVQASVSEQDGVAHHIVQIPSAQKTTEIAYAFLDGYLIIASSRDLLTASIRAHRSGESLAKSAKFLAALPSGNSSQASGLFYHDASAMPTLGMRQLPPEIASLLSSAQSAGAQSTDTAPTVAYLYGEESAIRTVSKTAGVNATAVLIGAAIAIPNLLRAKIAANESSAVASIRTVNTAQISYSSRYPDRGFAQDLAQLGPDPSPAGRASFEHANLIDAAMLNSTCAAGSWCEKNGFRFNVTTACKVKYCGQYVVIATPVSSSTGNKSFCSTSDAVIRSKAGDPVSLPITAAECRSWSPLQ